MKNRKLTITILFAVVLIIGFVMLLRQTNTKNDTSLATNGDKPKTEKPTKQPNTDGVKLKANKQVITTPIKAIRGGKTTANPATNQDNSNIRLVAPGNRKASTTKPTVNNSNIRLIPGGVQGASKEQEIQKLNKMLQNASSPAEKAKIKSKLNTVQ